MKKLVLIVSMFSVLAVSHSALAGGPCPFSGDRNANSAVKKEKVQTVANALGRTGVR